MRMRRSKLRVVKMASRTEKFLVEGGFGSCSDHCEVEDTGLAVAVPCNASLQVEEGCAKYSAKLYIDVFLKARHTT